MSDVFASGVQHDQAERACELNGGLARHALFSPIPETVSYPLRAGIPGKSYSDIRGLALAEGESACVSGYADYSLPLAWYGCVEAIHLSTGIGVTDQNSTLFHCVQSCGNKGNQYEYIGMDGEFCYCFESIDKHNPSCQKGHQLVGLFHFLSECCREQFQCYSCIFETPNTDVCVKCIV